MKLQCFYLSQQLVQAALPRLFRYAVLSIRTCFWFFTKMSTCCTSALCQSAWRSHVSWHVCLCSWCPAGLSVSQLRPHLAACDFHLLTELWRHKRRCARSCFLVSSMMPLLSIFRLPAPFWPNCRSQRSVWFSTGRKMVCLKTESSTPAPTSCTSMTPRHSTPGNAQSHTLSCFSSACI